MSKHKSKSIDEQQDDFYEKVLNENQEESED